MHHLTDCAGPPPSLLLALQWISAHKAFVEPRTASSISVDNRAFTALPYGLKGEAMFSCWSVKSIINHFLSHSNLQSSQQHPKKSCMLWQEWFPLKKIFSVFWKLFLSPSFTSIFSTCTVHVFSVFLACTFAW